VISLPPFSFFLPLQDTEKQGPTPFHPPSLSRLERPPYLRSSPFHPLHKSRKCLISPSSLLLFVSIGLTNCGMGPSASFFFVEYNWFFVSLFSAPVSPLAFQSYSARPLGGDPDSFPPPKVQNQKAQSSRSPGVLYALLGSLRRRVNFHVSDGSLDFLSVLTFL